VIKGQKVQISTLAIPALVIPMELSVGEVALTIALKGSAASLAA
jgi:CheY-specific phosphatase CheX